MDLPIRRDPCVRRSGVLGVEFINIGCERKHDRRDNRCYVERKRKGPTQDDGLAGVITAGVAGSLFDLT